MNLAQSRYTGGHFRRPSLIECWALGENGLWPDIYNSVNTPEGDYWRRPSRYALRPWALVIPNRGCIRGKPENPPRGSAAR